METGVLTLVAENVATRALQLALELKVKAPA
jgi:hypothetical protein